MTQTMGTIEYPTFPRSEDEKKLNEKIRTYEALRAYAANDEAKGRTNLKRAQTRGTDTAKWDRDINYNQRVQADATDVIEGLKVQVQELDAKRDEEKRNRFNFLAETIIGRTFGWDDVENHDVTHQTANGPWVVRYWSIACQTDARFRLRIEHRGELGFEVQLVVDAEGERIFGYDATVYGPRHSYKGIDVEKREPIYELDGAYPSWGTYSGLRSAMQARTQIEVITAATRLAEMINATFGLADEPVPVKEPKGGIATK
jgi:hypothetical protein